MKVVSIAAISLTMALLVDPSVGADAPKADGQPLLHELSMDVEVLQAFYALQLNDEQIRSLARFAKETADPRRKRAPIKENDEIRRVLTELRKALIDATDDDKIGNLEDEFDQLLSKEKVELDDSFETTKAARKRTAEVIKTLKASQLAEFYGSIVDDVLDPVQYLTAAFQQVRGLNKNEWRNKRDEIADELAWAVIGVEISRAEKLGDKVVALLSKARSLSNEEFKKQKADLEKKAQALVGEVGPDELLRHYAERIVADMLSNPRLEAAIKLMQK